MRRGGLRSALLVVAALLSSPAAEPLFFAFDNGVGHGKSTPVEQAAVLKDLGYDGIGYTGITSLAERQRAFADAGLAITSLYVACHLGEPPRADAGLLEALPLLKGHGIAVWLTVQGRGDDAAAAAAVRLVAEPAARLGVPVVLYPHHGFRVATAEQALPILEQLALPNVGLTINLCHELRAGNGPRLTQIVRATAEHLRLVSINGAEPVGENWSALIKPLGDGAFDVLDFLRDLKAVGYSGPVGLQCFAVPGDQRDNLRRSLATWRQYRAELAKP